MLPFQSCTGWGLHGGQVARPPVSSYLAFPSLPVALSLRLPSAAVNSYSALWSSDFPHTVGPHAVTCLTREVYFKPNLFGIQYPSAVFTLHYAGAGGDLFYYGGGQGHAAAAALAVFHGSHGSGMVRMDRVIPFEQRRIYKRPQLCRLFVVGGKHALANLKNFKGFQKALKKAGYCCSRLLYSQSVLNYCYAMYLLMDRQGIGEEEKESLLARWMTMVMLTGHYQSGGEGTVLKDYANATEEGFASYLAQIEELKLTEEFYDSILPDKFASTTARTAPFLVYVATQCARGVHSLYSDVTIEELYKNKTESYQILPKTYLAKCGYKTREIYGQVANLTYISKETKDIVKRKAPADYREKLEEIIGRESITASLQENGLTEEIFTAGEKDVTKILADRRKQMALEIKEFYKTL